jgi:SAM-dependent methyltransferase
VKKLNLGSGAFPKAGYVNVDLAAPDGADVIHDLSRFPYPFADDEFDVVEAAHCLEHLPEPFAVMKEIHRITRPGGTVHIWVPHFSRGFSHPEHKAGFDVTFPYYFRKDFLGGYQGVELELAEMRLRWFAQPYLKKTVLSKRAFRAASAAGRAINKLANASPELCSRLWCNWVGGFEEIEFCFVVRKSGG